MRDGGGDLAGVFPGASELATLMQELDWSATELGPVETWPEHLQSTVRLCLTARIPMVLLWGPRFAMLYNDAYQTLLGATKHPQFLGRPYSECWPELWPTVGPMLEGVFRTGVATFEDDLQMFFARRLPNEEVYVKLTCGPIMGPSGRIDGIFVPCIEVTEQIVGSRRLETLRKLGQIVEARTVEAACQDAARALGENPFDIPFAAIYTTAEGERAARLVATTGLPDVQLPPLISTELDPRWPLTTVLRTQQSVDIDLRALGVPAGPWPEPATQARALPIWAADRDTLAGILVVGVSPRRVWDAAYDTFFDLIAGHVGTAIAVATTYEAERRRAEALAEIDRAKTAFLSNISHEFRTPLTLMLAPIEDALQADAPSLDGAELERVYRNAQRLLRLVNTLLDFSSIEAGRIHACYRPTDLAGVTVDLACGFRPMIEKSGLSLVIDCSPLSQPVHVDRDMWEKIVLNLVSNAFKFTFSGKIVISLAQTATGARLVVKDTGTGIAPEHLPHVFDRFHRFEGTHGRSYEGSRIGLALVQELVRLHGGQIAVESTLGVGTTFTIDLPFGSASPDDQREARVPVSARAFFAEAQRWLPDELAAIEAAGTEPSDRILIVEDNADMRSYLKRLLGKRWRVEAVEDGDAALAAIRTRPPSLVITDVVMPSLDGFGLLRAMRSDAAMRTIPVIMLSARASGEAQIGAFEAGADDYIVKPFSARELVARVSARLELDRMGARLARERAAVAEVFRMSPQPVAIMRGRDLVYEFVNAHYIAALGGVDPTGHALREVMPTFEEQFGPALRQVIRTGVAYVGRETFAQVPRYGRIDDTYWTFIFASLPGWSPENDTVIAICNEVTEQVGTRRRLEALAASADAANRTKDEFLAMLGHELRNPLTPIVMSLQLMRLRDMHSPEQDVVERQVNHLRRLVDDLLDISRITRGKVELRKERIELASVVMRAVEMTTQLLEQREHRLELRVAASGLEIDADPDRMAQVFSNLLTNAAKYSEPGTRICIEAVRVDDRIRVCVIDEGVGIAAHMIDTVFDMFVQQPQTLDRARGGLGLGLAIVRSLVELHGGSVSVHSDGVDQGSRFSVELPASRMLAEQVAPIDARPLVPASSRRVLVVDDNDDAALALKKALELLGCAVAVAHDGPAALRTAAAFEPEIALLDIGLPVMDGYELAQRLRQQRDLHLIAVSGYGQESDLKRSADAGFEQHLVKPVDLAHLERVVKELR